MNIVYCARLGKDDLQVLKIAFFVKKKKEIQSSMSNNPNSYSAHATVDVKQ